MHGVGGIILLGIIKWWGCNEWWWDETLRDGIMLSIAENKKDRMLNSWQWWEASAFVVVLFSTMFIVCK
jgi:hypothetical protein